MRLLKALSCITILALCLAPVVAGAQSGDPLPSRVVTLVDRAQSWFLNIIISISVIMILVGAFYFVTAGGDEDKVETAKKYILYAAVGLAIALLAKAIVEIVQSFVA
jgi:hypothetical protein